MERDRIADLVDFIVQSVEQARAADEPFSHLVFPQVFPDDVYQQMLLGMPTSADYRRMSGRAKESILDDGTSTRVKLDLLPGHLDSLPAEQRELWQGIGQALCATEVQAALVRRLAPSLQRRFGDTYREMRLYPVPALFCDTPGYFIPPHTDTHWKGITVQFYLPCDDQTAHVGTVFHRTLPDGRKEPATRMTFAPNSGYAFAVGDDTWHSVDVVGPEVASRDSILLTYFVDAGWLRYVRNRGKRLGNLLRHRMTRSLRHVA
jgi:hypothetical protein